MSSEKERTPCPKVFTSSPFSFKIGWRWQAPFWGSFRYQSINIVGDSLILCWNARLWLAAADNDFRVHNNHYYDWADTFLFDYSRINCQEHVRDAAAELASTDVYPFDNLRSILSTLSIDRISINLERSCIGSRNQVCQTPTELWSR